MSVVEITRTGSAAWARINRPEAGNACSSAVMTGLEEWLGLAADPSVRVLVLTGTGRSFCAGADLTEATALLGDQPALQDFLGRGRSLVRAVGAAGVPTIAAVNGAAFGGGLELLLGCDIAVAAASARVGDRHISVGQVPGWGSSVLLPRAVGPTLARRLLLTGETWTGAEAERHGLVSEVVGDDELVDRVNGLVDQIASHDPDAVRRMLQVARPADDQAGWDREAATLAQHVASQHVAGQRADEKTALPTALRRRRT